APDPPPARPAPSRAPPGGARVRAGAPVRHAAGAGGDPAGVAEAAAGEGAAAADAGAGGGDVDRADAGVQRGPRVLVARVAHHDGGAQADDLRVLRPRGAGGADRDRGEHAGRAVPGGARPGRARGHRRHHAPPRRAVRPRPVEAAGARGGGVRPAHHRRERVGDARVLGRAHGGGVGGAAGGDPRALPGARGPARAASAAAHRGAAARDDAALRGDAARGARHHLHRLFRARDHPRHHPHGRRGVVDAPAGQRPGARHLVPAQRGRAARGGGDGRLRQPRDPPRRRAPLRLRHHGARAEHGHAAHGLRAAPRRDGGAGRHPRRPGPRQPPAGPAAGGDAPRPHRQRGARRRPRPHARRGDRRHHLHAPHRRARPRRRPPDRPVGPAGGRPRPRRREAAPQHLVQHRAPGHGPRPRVERPARANGPGGGGPPGPFWRPRMGAAKAGPPAPGEV
ncbi:MAG: FIG00841811: hypothetical protein, partial [uncultured Gemmatimonadetes bacterium]